MPILIMNHSNIYKDIKGEIWKHLDLMPLRYYMISNLGRCKVIFKENNIIDEKMVTQYINTGGYPSYNLQTRNFRIHRLLGIYFIPNPFNLPVVGHKDNNRLNYALDNLYWTTTLENNLHKIKCGRNNSPKGEKNGSAKLTNQQVKEIYLSDNCTLKELSCKYNISIHCISKIKREELWQSITSKLKR